MIQLHPVPDLHMPDLGMSLQLQMGSPEGWAEFSLSLTLFPLCLIHRVSTFRTVAKPLTMPPSSPYDFLILTLGRVKSRKGSRSLKKKAHTSFWLCFLLPHFLPHGAVFYKNLKSCIHHCQLPASCVCVSHLEPLSQATGTTLPVVWSWCVCLQDKHTGRRRRCSSCLHWGKMCF